jgi:hypothetical protein
MTYRQNRPNKGLSPKFERFRPVFVGKIVQIKELLVVKEPSPGFPGLSCSVSILSSGAKLMGRFLAGCKLLVCGWLWGFPRVWGLDRVVG